jgi:hypothetical protein
VRTAGLTPEQQRLATRTYESFVRRGARLNDADKARLSEINQALAGLFSDFGAKVLADENTWTVLEREEDLAGLPDAQVAAARAAAEERGLKGRWAIVNTRSSVDPFLTFSTRRDLREQVWKKFKSRGDNDDENDTKDTIRQIVRLRAERAKLLGYASHAHWRMDDTMARDPKAAQALMMQVWPAAVARVEQEVAAMKEIADEGGAGDHHRALGLPLLPGEGPAGAVRLRPGAAHAALRVEQHDRGRHVVGGPALRPRLQRDHRQGAGVPPGRARRGRSAMRPPARTAACSISTTGRGRASAPAPGHPATARSTG